MKKRSRSSHVFQAVSAFALMGGVGVMLLWGFRFALSGWLVCGAFVGLGIGAAWYELNEEN
jgi:hypothetical protein